MKTFTIRDLRERTGELVRGAESGRIAVVTKHGTPVFVALPFDETLIQEGVHVALAVKLFDAEVVSLSEAAKFAGISVSEMIDVLGARGIPVARYSAEEIDDDLRALR
jgi:prevent-host-death family protein